MNLSKRIENFYRRWQINLPESQTYESFKNRVMYALDLALGEFILRHPEITNRFAYIMGIEPPLTAGAAPLENLFPEYNNFRSTLVYKVFMQAKSLPELVKALQAIFWVLEEGKFSDRNNVGPERLVEFADEIKQAISISPGINLTLVRKMNSVILYPSGAQFLDEALIEDTLLWLESYPIVKKTFEIALIQYQSKEGDAQRNLLDNLRLALEQLLRIILGNKKSLENQEKELFVWLSKRGINQQIINMYQQLLFGSYRIYQNEAVKHSDISSPVEVEFMIYLTGTFMRLLIQLHGDHHDE